MTAVMQAVDALYRDKTMASDDSQIKYYHLSPPPAQHPLTASHNRSYSNGHTDWRNKYNEVADMLAETRGELDEFHASSKELEDELIKEIDRTEKAQQDLKVKVARTEMEREDWKVRSLCC